MNDEVMVLFLGNTPPHPAHQDLAIRVGAEVGIGVAHHRGWNPFRGLMQGWRLAHNLDWDALLAEVPCLEVFTLRMFDKRRRRLVRLDGMNAARRYAHGGDLRGPSRWIRLLELRQWDVIVVFNAEHKRAVETLVGKRTSTASWTPAVTLGDPFRGVVSCQQGPGVALITGGRPYRVEYKGLDRVASFSRGIQQEGLDPVTIFGGWAERIKRRFSNDVQFAGYRPPPEALTGAGFLVHLSRADAFGLAPVEAMLAGVPPVVARNGAGCAPIVGEVEDRLLVTSVAQAVETVKWLRSIRPAAFSELAERLRHHGSRYLATAAAEEHVADVRRALICDPPQRELAR